MSLEKKNIALLLGDPSGIGPELISKLLIQDDLNKANIIIIGEKKILENGNKITGNSVDLKYVEKFEDINFENGKKYFIDISDGKNKNYKLSECSADSGKTVLKALDFDKIHNKDWEAPEEIREWFRKFNHADNSYVAEKLVGLGPYRVTEFKTGQYIIIEKKADWWGAMSWPLLLRLQD